MTNFEVGVYRLDVLAKKYANSQDHMGEYHTDGYEFHYYNGDGNWVDIGWGDPFEWDMDLLEPLTPKYQELAEYESAVRQHQKPEGIVAWGDVANDIKEWREYSL